MGWTRSSPTARLAATTVQTAAEQVNDLALASDAAGSQHLCYSLSGRLIYASNRSGSWQHIDTDTLVAGTRGDSLAAAQHLEFALCINQSPLSLQQPLLRCFESPDEVLYRRLV